MAIDFTLPAQVNEVRERVRDFMEHEVHLSQIARRVLEAYQSDGTTRGATGAGLL